MPFEIVTIPCLEDNYAFLAHDPSTNAVLCVDVPEAAPIKAVLERRGWTLGHVLLTHHHADHVQGLGQLLADHPARVIGAAADAHRLPPLNLEVAPGDEITIGAQTGHVIDVSGHTVGHIATHFPSSRAVFTADSLMALGCGRIFEGTPEMMWASLSRLMALPSETIVYSGHEYTAANAKFALSVDPQNPALAAYAKDVTMKRQRGDWTVPTLLSRELEANPFLRADDPAMQAAMGHPGDAVSTFAEIRSRKDNF